jgi:hypothetical protein
MKISGFTLVKTARATLDSDASAFSSAAGLSDATQKDAVQNLVKALKLAGIWEKMMAIYPMVGGSADSHKFNLKNPANTNGAFRLTFDGGWTHSSTGAKPNGSTGYANTHLSASGVLTANNLHLSYYSRTQVPNEIENSLRSGSTELDKTIQLNPNLNIGYGFLVRLGGTVLGYNDQSTDCRGMFVASRTSSTSMKGYRNGNELISVSTGGSHLLPSEEVYLAAGNTGGNPSQYSKLECAFASIGAGLSGTEANDLYAAVLAFNQALSRNV